MDVIKTVSAVVQVIVAAIAALSAIGIIPHDADLTATLVAISAAAGGGAAGKDAKHSNGH